MQTPQLWTAVGAAFGEMDARLAGFSHPAAHRTHSWDLRCAADTMRRQNLILPLDRRSVCILSQGCTLSSALSSTPTLTVTLTLTLTLTHTLTLTPA